MISQVLPLSAGNALRLYLSPPAGATSWRVLRRNQGAFTGPDDAGAVVVVDASTDSVILDTCELVNGTAYSYAVFYPAQPSGVLVLGGVALGTPAATFQDGAPDIQELVAGRLRLGLAALA